MQVKEIMTKEVVTIPATMEVHKIAELFVEKNISGAPVIDQDGKCVGIVLEEGLIFQDKKVHLPTFINLTVGFLTLGTHRYEEEIKKIAGFQAIDIMDKDIIMLSPDAGIEEVATLMIEKNQHYFPVVKYNMLVGVVTKKDIVRAIAQGEI